MYNFEKTLKENGLTPETTSASLRKKIKDFKDLETELAQTKLELTSITDPSKKAEFETWIKKAEESLTADDAELTNKVKLFAKNRATYEKNAQNLKTGREKRNAAQTASAPAAAEPAKTTQATASAPAAAEPATAQTKTTPEKKEAGGSVEKKNYSWVAWALGVLALLGGALVGFDQYNRSTK